MGIHFVDVTIPLRNGVTVWPDDPDFQLEPISRIAQGDDCNVSQVHMSCHCGTHIDAPWHYESGGLTVEQLDPELFFGEALIIEVPAARMVLPEHLGEAPLPRRVLVKTTNSGFPEGAEFMPDYVALSAAAADRLVAEGVRLVGIDYLSVAPYQQAGDETHHTLLRNGVVVVEGLRLAGCRAGICRFTVLPLALVGADGAPCRAFVEEALDEQQ